MGSGLGLFGGTPVERVSRVCVEGSGLGLFGCGKCVELRWGGGGRVGWWRKGGMLKFGEFKLIPITL